MNKIITPISSSGTLPQNRTNTLENAKKLREERNMNLAMRGELALASSKDSATLANELQNQQLRHQPYTSNDIRFNKPGSKISTISERHNPGVYKDHNDLPNSNMTKKPFLADTPLNTLPNNAIYKKSFKLKQQEQDIDQSTKEIDEELNIINKTLNKRAEIMKNLNIKLNSDNDNNNAPEKILKNSNIRKVPISTSNSLASNDFNLKSSNANDEMYSPNFPSRLPKNQWNKEKGSGIEVIQSTNNFSSIKNTIQKNEISLNNNNNDHKSSNNISNDWTKSQVISHAIPKLNNYDDYSKTANFTDNDGVTDMKIFSKPNFKKIKEQKRLAEQEKLAEPDEKIKVVQNITIKSGKQQQQAPKNVLSQEPIKEEAEELVLCPEGCGRKFNPKALIKHASICKKVFGAKKKETKESDDKNTQNNKTNQPNTKAKNVMNETKGKWKLDSESLRAQIKAAKHNKQKWDQ